MGLSSRDFWRLTWWEWGLKVLKLHKDRMKELAERELGIEQTRTLMALLYNLNRGQNPIKLPQDFWPLSYDKKIVEERPMSFTEAKALLGSKIRKGNVSE